ncbi:hypothetical protein BHM03_00036228, partial [Ensete ventricosum]
VTICTQGVGGFVFGNENSASNEDRYKYALLISCFACCLRLQEAILSIPRGITRLMDMLMDREVRIPPFQSKLIVFVQLMLLSL